MPRPMTPGARDGADDARPAARPLATREGARARGAARPARGTARGARALPGRNQEGGYGMKRRRTSGMGRIFRRRSRLTGKELSTWWIAYFVDGKERREAAHSTEYEVAKRLLRKRLNALSEDRKSVV